MRTAQRRQKDQSGHAVMEFSLLIMTVVLIALGAATFGLTARNLLVIWDASASAAVWGANSTYNSSFSQTMQQIAFYTSLGVGTTSSTATNFCTCAPGSAAVPCSSSCGHDQPMSYVSVTTTTTYPSIFRLPGLPSSFQLSSTVVMPVD